MTQATELRELATLLNVDSTDVTIGRRTSVSINDATEYSSVEASELNPVSTDALYLNNIENTSTNGKISILMRSTGSGGGTSARITLKNDRSGNGSLRFLFRDGDHTTEAKEKFAFTSDGKLGVGLLGLSNINNPQAPIHVGTDSTVSTESTVIIEAPIYPSLEFDSQNTNVNNRRWKFSSVYNSYGTFEILRGATSGAAPTVTTMSLTKDGRVAIGPSQVANYVLDVQGDIHTTTSFRADEVRHSIRPSLNLDFANSKELDSRITFYRNSIATYYDSKGTLKYANINEPRFDHDPLTGESKGLLIEEARTNIFTYTNNPERWPLMSGSSSDPIANNIKSPDGTFNATSLIIDGSDPYFYQNGLTLNGTYTFSYWIKAVGTAIGKQYTTRITNVSSNSSTAGTLPSEWTRYTFTFTTGSTTTAYIGIEAPDNSPADGDEISIWGAQLELGAFATSLIPSDTRFTSRASVATYYDETGVLRTAPVNGARHGYKYDGRKWVETGLILEEASTNMLYHSTKGSDLYGDVLAAEALWTITDSSTDVTAPDGSLKTTKGVSGTSGNSWYWQSSPLSYTNGTTYTHSAWVRCAAGTTGTVSMNVYPQTQANGSAAATSITATDEWQRVSVTFPYNSALQNPYIGFVSPQHSRTFYFWGWQVEEQNQPTSYISTLGSALTRAADVASSVATTRGQDIANINDISWYNAKESTIYGEGTSISGTSNVGSSPCLWGITDGTSTNRYLLRRNAAGGTGTNSGFTFRLCMSGFNNDYFPVASVLPAWNDTQIHKMALSIKPNSQIAAADGIDGQMTSITIPEFDTPTMAQIGMAGSSTAWNGHIRKISYYATQLNLAELKALTENN
jgi:hypothetical protein